MHSMCMGWRSRQSVSVNENRWQKVWEQAYSDLEESQKVINNLREEIARITRERDVYFDQCRVLRLENRRLENELSMREMQDNIR